ncbi:MAG: hypothetical protein IJC48_08565 [Clostridia bacterium]|nr:hypothetical protein [Clostridia bacterium]
MTAIEAIERADGLRPNAYNDDIKDEWLKELDGRIEREILCIREGFVKEAESTGLHRTLFAEEPYSEMYVYYLMMKADFMNGETERFNNDAIMFNTAWLNYANHINRTRLVNTNTGIRIA